MECKFHVGQKVVCVDDDWEFASFVPDDQKEPKAGPVYTVTEVIVFQGIAYIWLEGFALYYEADAFRPVVERKTDISIFKAMLTPKNEQVPA